MQRVAKFAVIGLALFGVACGGASVKAGPMPTGGSFGGVWFSPQYGRLDIMQTGIKAVGEYAKDERSGMIQGLVRGNLMRFEWTEEKEMVEGMRSETRGKGYFQYIIDSDGDHKLIGRWGHDKDDTNGGPWNAVKSRKLKPTLSRMQQSLPPAQDDGDDSTDSDLDLDSDIASEESESAAPDKDDEIDDLSDL